MLTLFRRAKRQATSGLIGDIIQFRNKNGAYLNFIQSLTAAFTESNEAYGGVKVTKRTEGITKVTIKDSKANTEVGFIYRNRDLYIVGFVVGNTFYIDKEVYNDLKNQISDKWKKVINAANTVQLSNSFNYIDIMVEKGATKFQMVKLSDSLKQLTLVGDTSKRFDIMRNHLSPFVVLFSEAIRFPVLAREVQSELLKPDGSVSLSMNIVPKLGLGHPSDRNEVITLFTALTKWGKISASIPNLYGISTGKPGRYVLEEDRFSIIVGKDHLNALLGVANSRCFEKVVVAPVSRSKRDLSAMFDWSHLEPAQLDQQTKNVTFEGDVSQSSTPPPSDVASVTQSPDLIGFLYLLNVGMFYLYKKKMRVEMENDSRVQDPREAMAVAVDISDRIKCFWKSGNFQTEVGYEEHVELQKQIARALIGGHSVAHVLSTFMEQHYSDAPGNGGSLETLRVQLSKAFMNNDELVLNDNFPGDFCFQ